MGGGRGGQAPPHWIVKLLAKKPFFSISRGKKQILSLLAPPCKNFWENLPLANPWKNPSNAHAR